MVKLIMFLGLLFVINIIVLGYFYNKEYGKSVLDEIKINKEFLFLVFVIGMFNFVFNFILNLMFNFLE